MNIKLLLFAVMLICPGAKLPERTLPVSHWVIAGNGSLKVSGSTNISTFSCHITNFLSPDTLRLDKGLLQENTKMSGSIHLDVERFDCFNAGMTRDLRKALKSKNFPKMRIRFISLGWYPESNENVSEVKGLVSISLAGITRKFEVNYTISYKGDLMQLKGTRKISFSDFNIVPPAKLGGIVKTNNQLSVEFNLRLAQLLMPG